MLKNKWEVTLPTLALQLNIVIVILLLWTICLHYMVTNCLICYSVYSNTRGKRDDSERKLRNVSCTTAAAYVVERMPTLSSMASLYDIPHTLLRDTIQVSISMNILRLSCALFRTDCFCV